MEHPEIIPHKLYTIKEVKKLESFPFKSTNKIMDLIKAGKFDAKNFNPDGVNTSWRIKGSELISFLNTF